METSYTLLNLISELSKIIETFFFYQNYITGPNLFLTKSCFKSLEIIYYKFNLYTN